MPLIDTEAELKKRRAQAEEMDRLADLLKNKKGKTDMPRQEPDGDEWCESDAAHLEWAEAVVSGLESLARSMEERAEEIEEVANIHPDLAGRYSEISELIDSAVNLASGYVEDYRNAYSGVRETAEKTDGQIPGADPAQGYWSEVG